ncbi:MAG: PKD domain-containing protein, partial [Thermoplasmata archaeon]|nr:PKD domain-containing protein [Thermoplasmata archaeon]
TSSPLGPPPLSVVLTASTAGGSPPFRIAWVFGDRTTGTGASVHHVFASAGRFDVRAWANDSIGGSVTANLTEIASTPLGVGLTTASGSDLLDLGQNVTFNATPAGGEAPYQFSWSGLPRGCSPIDLSTLLCHPTQSGVSSVRVNITDSGGASAGSAALTLVVFPALGVNGSATPAMGCGPTSVNFSASGVGGSPPYAFAWTFGAGGDTAIGPSQTREFTTTGWHNATASATDPEGSHANRTILLLLVPCSASPPGPGGLTTLELGLVAIAAVVAIALVAVVVIRRRPPTR